MLPNFVVVGAPKAGTTALYWYLAEHPQVFMSPLKETNFFAYGIDQNGELIYGDPDLHKFPIRDLEEYESLFSGAREGMAIGEASPLYLECPQTADRMSALIPEARLICGLRDPVDRAYSDYQMYLRNRGRRLDAERDLRPDAEWAQPESHWMRIGRYHDQLARFYERFSSERIHVYLFDDLKEDVLAVVRRLYLFLEVDELHQPDLETPHNVGGVPSSMRLERFLTSKKLRALVDGWVPDSVANVARRVRTSNLTAAPRLPSEMRLQMSKVFAEDLGKTGELIGIDLNRWLPG